MSTRFLVLLSFFISVSFVLIGRLYYLQVEKGDYYRQLAEKNFLKIETINPSRGRIFDRNGVLLAYDVPYYELYIVPVMIKKEQLPKLKKNLEKYLGLKIDKDTEELIKSKKYRKIILKGKLSDEDLKRYYNYANLLNGVFVDVVPRRKYTEFAKYMPHVLGYASYPSKEELEKNPNLKPDMVVGKTGVERIYNDMLLGEYGERAVITDAKGRIKKVLWEKPPKEGKDIYLTIDVRFQKVAYEAFKNSGQKSGAVFIVDPKTYEIYSMLSYPTFDLQKFSDGLSLKEWQKLLKNKYKPLFNKALNGLYPPGSIYKIIVSTAALEEGVITPYTKIYSGWAFKIGKWIYRNWNPAGCGNINVVQALEQSCDTFFYQVGIKLGVDRIVDYTYLFGIGEKLNPKLETRVSRVPTPDWKLRRLGEPWFYGDTVNLSIGQGFLAITPFDSVKIVVPVVNGGKLLKPRLLRAYYDKDKEKLFQTKTEVIKRLNISSSTRSTVKRGMYMVVYGKRGTAKIMKEVPVENAGKTGTAQVYRKKSLKAKKDEKWELKNHAWFVDFFPYKRPQFVISTFVEHGGGGSKAAAPITKEIIEKLYQEHLVSGG